MRNRPNEDGIPAATVKGIGLGLFAFFLLSVSMVGHVDATPGYANWGIGGYYAGYSCCNVSDWGVDVKNSGMPADSNGDQTFAAFSASIYNGIQEYIAQIAIDSVNNGPFLYMVLMTTTGTIVTSQTTSVSGLLGNWHTLELKTNTTMSGGTDYVYFNWMMDGTIYHYYAIFSCTCSPAYTDFDKYIVPSVIVASPDNATSDFSSLDVHGYFEVPMGTFVGNAYFYPAYWGACPYGSQSTKCPAGGGGCPLPSGAQTSSPYVYLERDNEAPSNVGATGNVYSGYGASHEWGIGNYASLGYSEIYDQDLMGTLSGDCTSGPPQIA